MKKNILFSMTTVVERPDKKEQLLNSLRSIHKYEPNLHKYADIIIINEYSENGFKADFLKIEFPWINTIINKTKKYQGQVRSLNLIIDILQGLNYDYWLHFEESWVVTEPFLKICKEAMLFGIDQLQLTEDDWMKDYNSLILLPKTQKYIYIQNNHIPYKGYSDCIRTNNSTKYIEKMCRDKGQDKWPLWSLRPGIDRVSKILNIGKFNTAKVMWPVHFELEYAINWIMQPGGVIKAGIECVKRQKGHISFSETNYKF